MEKEMILLVSRFKKYLEERSEQQLRCFDQKESQVEGWFKGELIFFLDREQRGGRLHNFGREELLDLGGKRRRRIDITLKFDESRPFSWIELKHWIRTQNGTDWYRNHYYFKQNIKPDIEKLLKIPEAGDKFMLVLCTPKPTPEEWNSGIKNFKDIFSKKLNCSLDPLTKPDHYPNYFFLGLLHVAEENQH